ncbi:MAG: hypothetical protein Q8M16_19115, partial [Pirellulaceae bacterium]|nr:hypothetical protein [Pirellulaceae bacterium]
RNRLADLSLADLSKSEFGQSRDLTAPTTAAPSQPAPNTHMPVVDAYRSAETKIDSLYAAENCLRVAFATTSGDFSRFFSAFSNINALPALYTNFYVSVVSLSLAQRGESQ